MTKNYNLMPRVYFFLAGAVMYVVLTLVPMISSTLDWISGSVILLICPLRTIVTIRKSCHHRLLFLSKNCKGLLLRQGKGGEVVGEGLPDAVE